MKYYVSIEFRGVYTTIVEADSEDAAQDMALNEFCVCDLNELDPVEMRVDDVYEADDEEMKADF